MDSKKKNLTVCILFGLLLAVAFLACLFLPKEATSDSERRGDGGLHPAPSANPFPKKKNCTCFSLRSVVI